MQAAQTQPTAALTRGYLICLVGTTFWSTTGILIRYLTEYHHLPALVLAFWRDLFVAATLLIVLATIRRRLLATGKQHLGFLLTYGLVLSVFNASWTFSVALNGAAVSTVLAYSSPAFTALLAWRLLGEQITRFKALVILLSMLGTVLVSGAYTLDAWQINPLGVITGLVSGLLFAVYSLFGKTAARRSINSWVTLCYAFGSAAGFLLVYNLVASSLAGSAAAGDLLWLGRSLPGWGILLLLAVIPTIGGYGLYTLSLNYLPANVANLIATLEPALTALIAYFLLNEQLTPPQFGGSAIILLSVIALRLWEGRGAPHPGIEAGKSTPPDPSPTGGMPR